MSRFDPRKQFRLNQPHAKILEEAILQGHAIVPDQGTARRLGRMAHQTQGFTIARASAKTYNQRQTYLIPNNSLGILQKTENYIIFKNQKT